MEGKRLIIFDKDGTLMDTSPGSFATFDIMIKEHGLQAQPREKIGRASCRERV